MKIDPANPAALANRSAAQLKLKTNVEAIADATQAVHLRPTWAKAHLRLAAALRAHGQHGEAIMQLLCAAALDHKDSVATTELLELAGSGHDLPSLDGYVFPSIPSPRRIPVKDIQEIREEFDCCMCSSLLFEPTVLPCGHCMCRDCVARLLDHALQTEPCCPLCRHDLMPLLRQINLRANEQQRAGLKFSHGAAQLTVCSELARLLTAWFPTQYEQRLAEVRAPQSEWVPIFVCSLSAPFIPTPLHIFEPRYRLMMRRCLESNQRFGMCLPAEEGFADSGTMLFIDKFEQLPDGRSLVGCTGVSRFSILERGTLDGYSTALIRPFEEDAKGFQESAKFHFEALALHEGAKGLLTKIGAHHPELLEQLDHQLGPLPEAASPHFDAHMSFYVTLLLSAVAGVNDSSLIFHQPENERWQKILEHCVAKPFAENIGKSFAEALQKMQHEVANTVVDE